MRMLIVDESSCGLDIALRAKAYGHQVRCFMKDHKNGDRSEAGDGMIERVPHWEPHMKWADLIFLTDNTFYIHALERYRKQGYPIFGCNLEGRSWEQDREVGAEVLNRAGIETIPMQTFSNYDEAIEFVLKNPKRWVSKPLGDGEKALSYCSKTAADMVYMLQKWKKEGAYKGKFILQEFCKGVEFGVGGWFGLDGFSKWWCESWEHKKLMNDDLGVNTGEQGTIVRYTETSKLARDVLKPLEGMLHGIGYTGYIDVNCIIPSNGNPLPLEFTMRPGWPLFQIQQALHKGDPIEWMADLIDGRDTLRCSTNVACGVVISIPEYPYDNLTAKECSGYPLFGITEDDLLGNIHATSVQCGKAPSMDGDKVKLNTEMYVTSGNYIGTVTGVGETVEVSRERCYNRIKSKIDVPNSIGYRTDIGCKLKKELPILHEHGYATGVRY